MYCLVEINANKEINIKFFKTKRETCKMLNDIISENIGIGENCKYTNCLENFNKYFSNFKVAKVSCCAFDYFSE